jgi:hypothetical protein
MTDFAAFCKQRLIFALAKCQPLMVAVVALTSATPALAVDWSGLSYGGASTDPSLSALEVEGTLSFDSSASTLLAGEPVQLANNPLVTAPEFLPNDPQPVLSISDLESGINPQAVLDETDGEGMAQVTSVSEFSDVLPTDWAFQALQNLVETYGCIEGYPDGTYRGQRALTRFEFAAGLNSCLNVISQLAAQGVIDPDELATIRQLQEEFRAELTSLEGRVDALEMDVAELRAQQFSTVTKLRGRVFAQIGGGFRGGEITAEGGSNIFFPGRVLPDPNTGVDRVFYRDPVTNEPFTRTIDENPGATVSSLAWINFDTSFTGEDLLKLQFVAGSGVGPANLYGSSGLFNTFGTPFTFQTGGVAPFQLAVRELSYQFPVGDQLTVDIGPRVNWYSYFDNNRYTFFLTGANSFNSSGGTLVNAVDRGAGAVVVWDVTDWLDLRLGYLAENTEFLPGLRTAADPARGLFGGTNTLTGQIGLQPVNNLNLRLLYTRTSLQAFNGLVGGTNGEPIYGFADNGVGGDLTGATADTFLVNFDYTPFDWLGFFGRYTYATTDLRQLNASVGDINMQSFQVGLGFPDLFKEGALATVSYLVPFDVTGGRNFLVSGGGDGGTQQELEFSYRYPMSPNIALMPSFYWVINPNNFSSNPDLYFFNLQAQLSF